MMLIYDSEYLTLKHDHKRKIIFRHWKPDSEDMNEKTFKAEMLRLLELVRQYRPRFLLGDTKNFNFVILPDVQEWCDELVYSEFGKLGVKKMAMVTSDDYYAQLSVEQAIEESPKYYEIKYFYTQEDGIKWLEE